jgi:hypothetical protein
MRYPLWTAALLVALGVALFACQRKRPEPVPGPQSSGAQHTAATAGCPQSRLFRF